MVLDFEEFKEIMRGTAADMESIVGNFANTLQVGVLPAPLSTQKRAIILHKVVSGGVIHCRS